MRSAVAVVIVLVVVKTTKQQDLKVLSYSVILMKIYHQVCCKMKAAFGREKIIVILISKILLNQNFMSN